MPNPRPVRRAHRHTPFEKEEMRLCDALILKLGGEIVSFAQPRATKQTPGIPDRRYRIHGVAFWWECKSQDKDAKLTAAQSAFLHSEWAANSPAACGTVHDLAWYLLETRRGKPLTASRTLLERWDARGFRRVAKPRRPHA